MRLSVRALDEHLLRRELRHGGDRGAGGPGEHGDDRQHRPDRRVRLPRRGPWSVSFSVVEGRRGRLDDLLNRGGSCHRRRTVDDPEDRRAAGEDGGGEDRGQTECVPVRVHATVLRPRGPRAGEAIRQASVRLYAGRSRTTASMPPPGASRSSTSPSSAATSRRTIARPKPGAALARAGPPEAVEGALPLLGREAGPLDR